MTVIFIMPISCLAAANDSATSSPPGKILTCEQVTNQVAPLFDKDDAASLNKAREMLADVLDRQSDCVPALVGCARALDALGGFSITQADYYTAFEYLARASVLAPDNAEALWVMANMQRHIGRIDRAMLLARKAVQLAPKDPWAHFIYGSVLMNSDMKAAAGELEQALGLKPGWAKAEFNLSAAYIGAGDYARALPKLEEYVKFGPTDVKGFTNLGMVYIKLGKINEAEESYKKALEIDPRFGLALKGLGDVAVAKKDFLKAIEQYKLASVSMSTDPSMLALLGETQVKAGFIGDAISTYKKALEQNPKNQQLVKILTDLEARQASQKKP